MTLKPILSLEPGIWPSLTSSTMQVTTHPKESECRRETEPHDTCVQTVEELLQCTPLYYYCTRKNNYASEVTRAPPTSRIWTLRVIQGHASNVRGLVRTSKVPQNESKGGAGLRTFEQPADRILTPLTQPKLRWSPRIWTFLPLFRTKTRSFPPSRPRWPPSRPLVPSCFTVHHPDGAGGGGDGDVYTPTRAEGPVGGSRPQGQHSDMYRPQSQTE